MSLPSNVQALIGEYSKPVTRANWRQGSNCCASFKYSDEMTKLHQVFLKFLSKENESIRHHSSFTEDMHLYGEDIFEMSPHTTLLGHNNFYFMLRRYFMLNFTGMLSIRQLIYWKDVHTDQGIISKQYSITELDHFSEIKDFSYSDKDE
jgi:hypothetical protein